MLVADVLLQDLKALLKPLGAGEGLCPGRMGLAPACSGRPPAKGESRPSSAGYYFHDFPSSWGNGQQLGLLCLCLPRVPLGTAAVAHHFPPADGQTAVQPSEDVLIYDFAAPSASVSTAGGGRRREVNLGPSWSRSSRCQELTEPSPVSCWGGSCGTTAGTPRAAAGQWLVSAVNNTQLGTEVGFC